MSEEKPKKKYTRREMLLGAFRRKSEESMGDHQPISRSEASESPLKAANQAYGAGDLERAVDLYREFVKLEPNNPEARKRLGHCLYHQGRHLQARVEFERVLRIREKDNFSSLFLGLTHCRMGKPDKAVQAWRSFFSPKEVEVMREINVQIALIESGDHPAPSAVADSVEETLKQAKKRG